MPLIIIFGPMKKIPPVNLRSFKARARHRKTGMRRFLTKLDKHIPRGLDQQITGLEKEVWKEIDCLSCANCCKTMTPTFNKKDLKRISSHFKMTIPQFQKKWLKQERHGDKDWINKWTPCQFLDIQTNMCRIYTIRPADCAGFPHLSKKFKEYVHIHKQNVEFCPATYALVEKLQQTIGA